MPIYKKSWKEDFENYRLVSLSVVLREIMEQIILQTFTWHIQDNQIVTRQPDHHTQVVQAYERQVLFDESDLL